MDYLDFIASITERGQIKDFIESDAGVEQLPGGDRQVLTFETLQVARPARLRIIC